MRLWRSLFLLRRVIRALEAIGAGLVEQNRLLTRLADRYAPVAPQHAAAEVAEQSGVDYVDPIDQVLIQQYIVRTEHDTGRPPTDDEILSYLADEKTRDLHVRLIARDREIERLSREPQ